MMIFRYITIQAVENLKLSEPVFSDVLSPSFLSPCACLHTVRNFNFKPSFLCLSEAISSSFL